MKLASTRSQNIQVSLKQAVLQGLAPDGGLFLPTEIPELPEKFFQEIENLSFQEIAFEVAKTLIGEEEISHKSLKQIVDDSINFEAPLVKIGDIYTLELFHGPTLAFKDFGGRFLSRLTAHFLKEDNREITVLAATSGDTGSAVGNGFLNIPNTKVVLLYPSGKVSKIQELQLTTMGNNVSALEINGTFDDCQRLVKTAFNDDQLHQHLNLTSANSINIARLIPQTFYYFAALAQAPHKQLVISVPSGNLGNLTAGLIAKKMGLPILKFIAATNANNTFKRYLKTGNDEGQPTIQTISNAMDVGTPSNLERLQKLYNNDLAAINKDIVSYSFSDQETATALKAVEEEYGYTMDPHGAVGYLGLKKFLSENPLSKNISSIFFETAHPAKFADIVEPLINRQVEIPETLSKCLRKEKQAIQLSSEYEDFKTFLLR